MAANGTDGDGSNAARPPAELVLDPQLLMAARRGDCQQLKQLLRLNHDDDTRNEAAPPQQLAPPPPPAVAAASVIDIVEVVHRRPPAAAPQLDGVTMEGDTLLHVAAACGDSEEFLHCAKMIYCKAKRLLVARNSKGDTPLHCAAGAGNAEMIVCLVGLAAQGGDGDGDGDGDGETSAKAFLRMHNNSGETALHQAVRAASENKQAVCCIHHLMAVDPELASIPFPHDEDGGASPLYLAISQGELDIARYLKDISKGNLSCSGPNGRNVLHAAVSCAHNQALPMVLGWLKQLKSAGDMRSRCSVAPDGDDDDLLSQLTSQSEKKNGSTPLHLAASLDGLPSTIYVPIWSPRGWGPSMSATKLLLGANVSTAYQPDKEGLYPIHVASGAGSLDVVKTLLQCCPDCATMRDAKGRTLLHIAVEKKRWHMVNYVCGGRWRNSTTELLSSILNMQDENGDTALHHAVRAGDLRVFLRLRRNPHVRLDVLNKEGMTPIDVAWDTMPLKAYYAWDARIHIRTTLLIMGAPYGENRGDLFDDEKQRIITRKTFKGGETKISENLTAAAQVLAIFSVLITTVTFASAFALPGGYRSDDGGGGVAGTPVLAGSYAFDAFLLSDALAFVCSFFAASLLLYAGVPVGGLDDRFATINLAYSLMWTSGRSLVAAFALGLYVTLLPVIGRAIAIAMAIAMILYAFGGFTKASEGIDSLLNPPIRRRRQPLPLDVGITRIVSVLEHFWSYILIFGLPAIRMWAREG